MNTDNNGVWQGSTRTASMVAHEIANRYGEEAVKRYDPMTNCLTLKKWNELGYRVKKGEKSIRSVTWISTYKENDNGEKSATGKYPKTVCLFFDTQVEKRMA